MKRRSLFGSLWSLACLLLIIKRDHWSSWLKFFFPAYDNILSRIRIWNNAKQELNPFIDSATYFLPGYIYGVKRYLIKKWSSIFVIITCKHLVSFALTRTFTAELFLDNNSIVQIFNTKLHVDMYVISILKMIGPFQYFIFRNVILRPNFSDKAKTSPV